MAAGEAVNPRSVLPKAYNGVFYRLTTFFVLGSLCVGILVPYNDKTMTAAFNEDKPGAAASPYVIAMDRLGIPVLPHIVNAMVLGASFSAGNSYVYCASRSLYGLALDGKAPRFFTKCTRAGVPIYCVGLVLMVALLAFLQVSNNASVVLDWFVNIVSFLSFFSSYTYIQHNLTLHSTGHRIPTDQLLRLHIHLYPIQKSPRRTRYISRFSPLQKPRPAVRRLHRPGIDRDHGVRRWLRSLPTWEMGRGHVFLLVYDDRGIPHCLHWVEACASDESAEARGGGFGVWGC